MVELFTVLVHLLAVFVVAIAVQVLTERIGQVPYTVVLVLVGFGFSLLGLTTELTLSHDIILFVFIPAILFQGATEIDARQFAANLPSTLPLVVVGLPTAVILIGLASAYAFPMPLLIALLFGSIIYPIDPVAVLAVYREMDAPERLSVITESESLMDDGLAIIVFTTIFGLVQTLDVMSGSTAITRTANAEGILLQFVTESAGGVLVGLIVGYAAYLLMHELPNRMSQFLLTLVSAYGSFVLAHHYLYVNGILAVVLAGLVLGSAGREHVLDEEMVQFLTDVWEALVFVANTTLFLLIGLKVQAFTVLEQFHLVLAATGFVLVARAVVVYAITYGTNHLVSPPVPMNYRHVLVWGGLHAAIPVALVLSLPPVMPYRDLLRTLVFGVVVVSIIVQGLLMPVVLRATGVTRSGRERGGS